MNRSYWKFLIAFAAIILLVLGGYWVWNNQLNLKTEDSDEPKATYEEAIAHQEKLEEAMRNDTYGGKTPQETLDLFIEVLRKEDIELAFKYFAIEGNGERDSKWREGLIKTKEAGRLQGVADSLSKAQPDFDGRAYEKDFKFYVEKDGEIEIYIDMEFNEYSSVWKIESL